MILEVVIIICLVLIVILLARRLPNVLKKNNLKFELPKIQFPKKEPENASESSFWHAKNPKKSEGSDRSNYDRANEYFNATDYKEAEKYYIKAAAEDPHNPKIYNRLGIIYSQQKNYRDAKEAFQEALRFDDKLASRHINYGLACLNLKNYIDCVKAFEKAVKIDAKNEKYQLLLKDAKQKKKLFEKK